MAVIATKAIVFGTIKFGENSIIGRLYTKELGLVSYLMKGIMKSKKRSLKVAYFQPLTQLSIIANHQEKRSLQSIKEARVINVYHSIDNSVIKQAIVLFLSEVLSKAIQEEEKNILLFDYLEKALVWFDSHHQISNFHLLFLLNLTKFFGFYPDISSIDKAGFLLKEGLFTNDLYENEIVKGHELFLLRELLGTNFDRLKFLNFSKAERLKLLRVLIRYFEFHLADFKVPKSLSILETVFM